MDSRRCVELVLLVLCFLHSTGCNSVMPETLERDFEAIEEAVLRLNRPDFMEIPHLIQNVNVEAGYSTYKWAEDVEGIPDKERDTVALKRNSMDLHVKTIIFPSGQFSFGQPLNRSYVVLRRHSTEKDIFFFNLAYLRDDKSQTVVEWTTYNPKLYDKSREERELCQAEACDFPEWILGTCHFVSHVCSNPFPPRPNSTSPSATNQTSTPFVQMLESAAKKREATEEEVRRRRGLTPVHVRKRSTGVVNGTRPPAPNPSNASMDHIPDSFDLLQMEQEDNRTVFFRNHVKRRHADQENMPKARHHNSRRTVHASR